MLIKIQIECGVQIRANAGGNQTGSGCDKRFGKLDLQDTITRGCISCNLIHYFLKADVPLASILWDDTDLEEARGFSEGDSDLVPDHAGGAALGSELNASA